MALCSGSLAGDGSPARPRGEVGGSPAKSVNSRQRREPEVGLSASGDALLYAVEIQMRGLLFEGGVISKVGCLSCSCLLRPVRLHSTFAALR